MSPPAYFVILGSMRTGSNLLEATLALLPGVETFGEAFNPAFPGRPKNRDQLGWTVAARDRDPLGFLARLIEAPAPGGIAGFRLFDGHNAAVMAHVLADPACARLILRRHPLETYVSLKIARATDQWLLRNPRRRRTARVRFEPAEFRAHAEADARFRARVDRALADRGLEALRLDYADLAAPARLADAANWIGRRMPDDGLAPPIHRQNPGPLDEKVENPAEMWAALAAMGLAAPAQNV